MSLMETAEGNVRMALSLREGGDHEAALGRLRLAVFQVASAIELLEEAPSELWQTRAEACRRLGAWLMDAGSFAEAAAVYQEATDSYGRCVGAESEAAVRECAARSLAAVRAVQRRPDERLHLLTVRYERLRQQRALEAGAEAKQADCCVHIARIFQRRDRPELAIEQFKEAIRLFEQTPPEETGAARAECHHRIAGLYANALDAPANALRHYREAIALYRLYEPAVYDHQPALALCLRAVEMLELE